MKPHQLTLKIIQAELKRKGLTQKQMLGFIGYTRQTLISHFRKDKDRKHNIYKEICAFFNEFEKKYAYTPKYRRKSIKHFSADEIKNSVRINFYKVNNFIRLQIFIGNNIKETFTNNNKLWVVLHHGGKCIKNDYYTLTPTNGTAKNISAYKVVMKWDLFPVQDNDFIMKKVKFEKLAENSMTIYL